MWFVQTVSEIRGLLSLVHLNCETHSLLSVIRSFILVFVVVCCPFVTSVQHIINFFLFLILMALNSLYCADVPLSNYSLTLSDSCE